MLVYFINRTESWNSIGWKSLAQKKNVGKNENFLENLIGHANYGRQLIFNRKLSLYYWYYVINQLCKHYPSPLYSLMQLPPEIV